MVWVSVSYLFYQPINEKIKTWTLCCPSKKTLIWRRHCSIGQSCCNMTSKRSIGWFLEKFFGLEVFLPEGLLNQPKATRVCIRSINQSNRSISVRLLFLFCSRVIILRSYENRSNCFDQSHTIRHWYEQTFLLTDQISNNDEKSKPQSIRLVLALIRIG